MGRTNNRSKTAARNKGQAAVEMLVMAGFVVAFLMPIALLFLSSSNAQLDKASLAQAKAAARTIANEAGEIYLQGEGAEKTILVNYPGGIVGGEVGDGLVMIKVDSGGRENAIIATTFANIRPDPVKGFDLKKGGGLQKIKIENVGDQAGTGIEEVEISYVD